MRFSIYWRYKVEILLFNSRPSCFNFILFMWSLTFLNPHSGGWFFTCKFCKFWLVEFFSFKNISWIFYIFKFLAYLKHSHFQCTMLKWINLRKSFVISIVACSLLKSRQLSNKKRFNCTIVPTHIHVRKWMHSHLFIAPYKFRNSIATWSDKFISLFSCEVICFVGGIFNLLFDSFYLFFLFLGCFFNHQLIRIYCISYFSVILSWLWLSC